jgi:hypothetical protein
MTNPYLFNLIDGTFSAEDARKIVIELIQSKINFHEREVMRLEEQGENPAHSRKRIERLKDSADCLINYLSNKELEGKKLKVKSVVELSWIE